MTDSTSGAALTARFRNQVRHAVRLLERTGEAVAEGTPADTALHALFRENRQYGGRDRRLFTALTFAWFRWRGWVANPGEGPDMRSVAFAAGLEGGFDAEILQAFCTAAEIPLPPDGLDNAALDRKAALFAGWRGGGRAITPADLAPEALLALLDPAIEPASFLVSIQARPPVWLRLRSPRAETEVLAALAEIGLAPIPSAVLPQALRVRPSTRLQEVLRRFPTALQVQSLASQAVGAICAARPGESWWDACCGSGGKTLLLLDVIGPDGRIVASDIRGPVFDEFAKRVGPDMAAVRTRVHDATRGTLPGGSFEGVLVDAPCSGLGTWARQPDARWRLRPEHIDTQARRQEAILDNAAKAVRPGGRLVYSVCTLSAAETTGVADGFDRAHPGFAALPFVHPLRDEACPAGRAWIAPHESLGDGMFVAAWKRIA